MTPDFNDIAPLPDPTHRNLSDAECEELRVELLARLESVLIILFLAGKKCHGKFPIGDVLGSPGDSLEVALDGEKAGLWTDRTAGDGDGIYALVTTHLDIGVPGNFPRMLDAAADLIGRPRSAPIRKANKKDVPVDELDPVTARRDYLDAQDRPVAIVYHYDPPGQKKQFRPWDAKRRGMVPSDSCPLYNQSGTASTAQVVLVEGEKCAQALIDAGIVITTAMYGANAPVKKTDWPPLFGKAVLIWPDCNKPGWEYATQAAQAVLSAGAKSCHVPCPPKEVVGGRDVTDAIAEGFNIATFFTHGPCLQMHDMADNVNPIVSNDKST